MNQILFYLQKIYEQIPGWVITGLASGFTAITGLAAKFCWDWIMAKRELKYKRIDRLEKFSSMITESKQLASMQAKLAETLSQSIKNRLKLDNYAGGYDSLFANYYSTFTEAELETHSMIRSISLNSLNRINAVMLDWIDENPEFKNNSVFSLKKNCGKVLAKKISNLELHLNLWQDKFAVWIPINEKHALVTIGDEDCNGIPMSEDMEDTIKEAINTISDRTMFSYIRSLK